MDKINWNRLQEIYEKCCSIAVSFSMHYEESCDTFYFTIDSAAKNENYMSKSSKFEYGIDMTIKHLNKFVI